MFEQLLLFWKRYSGQFHHKIIEIGTNPDAQTSGRQFRRWDLRARTSNACMTTSRAKWLHVRKKHFFDSRVLCANLSRWYVRTYVRTFVRTYVRKTYYCELQDKGTFFVLRPVAPAFAPIQWVIVVIVILLSLSCRHFYFAPRQKAA